MNIQGSQRPTATIHQFPVGGRFGRAGRLMDGPTVSDFAMPKVYESAVGESWYHEAAIRDAERTSKP